MVNGKKIVYLLGLLFLSTNGFTEVLKEWKRVPIDVDLSVNQERIIFIDRNVMVGFPPAIKGKLRVQSAGGAVYLKATSTFPETDIQMKDVENGEIFLFKITAINSSDKKNSEAIKIIHTEKKDTSNFNSQSYEENTLTNVTDESASSNVSNLPIPAALIRYAAQSLYAPLRTVEPVEGISSTSVPRTKLTSLLPDLPVVTTPISAWKLDNYTVVAVSIKNKVADTIYLDPRDLQGDFYAAAFQHPYIGHVGYPEDTTTVYLVIEGNASRGFIPEPRNIGKRKNRR